MSISASNSNSTGEDISKKFISDDPNNATKLEDVVPKLEKLWFRYPWLLKLNIFLLGGILAQVTSGYDGSMMNNLQTLPSWKAYFNEPSGAILSTMSNGVAIGTLISIPFTWAVCDFFGRRWTIIVGCFVIVIGAAIQGGSVNFGMFTAARILLGIGSCLASAAASPLLAETSFPSQRPIITALLLASWPFGSFIAALVTWGPYHSSMKYNNWSWRLPSILQAFFPLLELIIAFFGPESPRWLINQGRIDEAREFFIRYHAGGDRSSPLVAFEMAEIQAIIEQDKIQRNSKWKEWVKSKQRLRRLFIVLAVPAMAQLCGNALISYYLTIVLDNIGITATGDQLKLNLGLTVYGLFWSVGCAMNVGRFKRRTMFITGYILMCSTYVIWTILSAIDQQANFQKKAMGRGVVAMIYLFSGFYHLVAPVSMTYVTEICPYHLRAQGSTMYQLSGNVVGFFNNYVNNIAMVAIKWKYYIVWCIWLVVQMNIVYWIFPETKGLGLEEVAQVFGEDISAGIKAGDEALENDANEISSKSGIRIEHLEESPISNKALS